MTISSGGFINCAIRRGYTHDKGAHYVADVSGAPGAAPRFSGLSESFVASLVASFVDGKEKTKIGTRIRLRTETTPGHVGTKTKSDKAHDKSRDKGPASRGSQKRVAPRDFRGGIRFFGGDLKHGKKHEQAGNCYDRETMDYVPGLCGGGGRCRR